MSAMKLDQLTSGASVFLIDVGNKCLKGTVVIVKTRSGGKPQVCIDTEAALGLYDYFPERFFSSEREAWFAVAMFSQREATKRMADADVAFKKAGTASPEETAVTA